MTNKETENFFDIARTNMVKNQIMPYGVSDESIISALLTVAKHDFIENEYKEVSYLDSVLPVRDTKLFIDDNVFLMPTDVFAKLLQHSGLNSKSRVLDVACNTGYSTTIIAQICEDLTFIDHDKWLLNRLAKKLKKAGHGDEFCFDIIRNFKDQRNIEPFDIIIVNGIIDEVPYFLDRHLQQNGKLLCLMREKYAAQAVCFTKKSNKLVREDLFNVDADDRLRLKF